MMIGRFQGSYRWLSNFAECVVRLDGVEYPTTEHAYQAAKTLDPVEREHVRSSKTPGVARRRGQKVTLREDWEDVKIPVMQDLLEQKFTKPHYTKLLLKTGNQNLVEGNTWGDQFWGCVDGEGENHLGRLLMKLRETLRKFGFGND